MKMPMITLPAIPTLFALVVFLVVSIEGTCESGSYTIAKAIVACIAYFAMYGLCTAIGL